MPPLASSRSSFASSSSWTKAQTAGKPAASGAWSQQSRASKNSSSWPLSSAAAERDVSVVGLGAEDGDAHLHSVAKPERRQPKRAGIASRPVEGFVRRRHLPIGTDAAGMGYSISYWMKTLMESSTSPGRTGVLAISSLAAPMAMVSREK